MRKAEEARNDYNLLWRKRGTFSLSGCLWGIFPVNNFRHLFSFLISDPLQKVFNIAEILQSFVGSVGGKIFIEKLFTTVLGVLGPGCNYTAMYITSVKNFMPKVSPDKMVFITFPSMLSFSLIKQTKKCFEDSEKGKLKFSGRFDAIFVKIGPVELFLVV